MFYLGKLSKKELFSKICLLRIDLNLKSLRDSFRLDAILPTLKFLLKNNSKILILSHRGRPKKASSIKHQASKQRQFSLQPIGKILSKKLGRKITFLKDFNFRKIRLQLQKAKPGTIFLLENLRFLKGEKENSASLAKKLASLGDLYVNDAFAVSHRADASVVSIAKFLKSYAGLLLEKEIKYLSYAIKNPKKPFVVIIGGAKISDKIGVIKNLWRQANCFLLGSSARNDLSRNKLGRYTLKLHFPKDTIKSKGKHFDIGPKTAVEYQKIIGAAKTIIWNGPLGMFENKNYIKGSAAVAKAISKNKKAKIIIGGGETVTAFQTVMRNYVKKVRVSPCLPAGRRVSVRVSPRLFLSTGGGAMLDFLSGKKLPGIVALERTSLAKSVGREALK